jgi:hypothetical protein
MSMDNDNQAQVAAISKDGVTYVPLAAIVRQLGGSIDWNHERKLATLNVRGHSAEVDMNDNVIRVDGQNRSLASMPIIEEDRVYVTPDFLDQIGLTHT